MKHIAILGFGVVGSGVAELISRNSDLLERKLGTKINIKYILDLREFPDSPFADKVVHDFNIILNDPEVSIVAEMMGGSHPAYDFSKACILAKKSVITSNKEVVANFGVELIELAKLNNVKYMFEASVGGGIPVIRPLINDLASNNIISIDGILNGTTNYILTQMDEYGSDFSSALKNAQKNGYAEANPAADVEGLDAARKIVILASLAFGAMIEPAKIHVEGISNITSEDINNAKKLGYAIKLVGHAQRLGDGILAMVSPRFVPMSSPLYTINDVFNGILVDSDMLGKVMFYGRGAGKLPTASAVVSDLIDIVERDNSRSVEIGIRSAAETDIADFGEYVCRSYFVFAGNESQKDLIKNIFGDVEFIEASDSGKLTFISPEMSEAKAQKMISECPLELKSRIRLL